MQNKAGKNVTNIKCVLITESLNLRQCKDGKNFELSSVQKEFSPKLLQR